MTTNSIAMKPVDRQLELIVKDNRPILITGETGSGKSWLARLIHDNGVNSEGELVKIYCSGHSEDELRTELFGSLTALTGSNHEKPAIARANRGTLLIKNLDINHLNLFNEIYHFFSESGNSELLKHTRLIVTLTHKAGHDLTDTHAGYSENSRKFWHIISIPPLRLRREEIPTLIQKYFDYISSKYSLLPQGVSFRAMYRCISYSWPGNIRELHNAVEYASLLSNGLQIEKDNLPAYMLQPATGLHKLENKHSHLSFINAERNLIHTILQITNSKEQAAELLGLSLNDLIEYMGRYNLKPINHDH